MAASCRIPGTKPPALFDEGKTGNSLFRKDSEPRSPFAFFAFRPVDRDYSRLRFNFFKETHILLSPHKTIGLSRQLQIRLVLPPTLTSTHKSKLSGLFVGVEEL